jgi:acyl-CoA thioesterase FadM
VAEFKRRTIRFSYEILHDETGELLATGATVHVVCDSTGKPKTLPEKYCRFFDTAATEEISTPPVT